MPDYLGLAGFVLSRPERMRAALVLLPAVAASLGFPEPFRFDPCTLPNVFKRVNGGPQTTNRTKSTVPGDA